MGMWTNVVEIMIDMKYQTKDLTSLAPDSART